MEYMFDETALLQGTYLLQQVDKSLEDGFRGKYTTKKLTCSPGQDLDELVKSELSHLHNLYQREEDVYVETGICEELPFTQQKRSYNKPELMEPVQIKRAEASRRSRFRSKIKQTKQKRRLQFCKNALKEHQNVMNYVNQIVDCAELKLIQAGFNRNAFLKMREAIGIKDVREIGLNNNSVRDESINYY